MGILHDIMKAPWKTPQEQLAELLDVIDRLHPHLDEVLGFIDDNDESRTLITLLFALAKEAR